MKNTKGEIDKTVTKMQQTNEEFNKSIEILTKKSEITNELNTVKIPAKVDGAGSIEGHIDETDKKEGTQ
ncbi:TPA: hypothetical protein QCU24_004888 [Bacillus cereus]|uniref:Uncharacterized protein n=2 Tax=Bacillus cereus group TaxID=86661 RepID=A0A9W5V8U2_BACCE|nr:hypothetical protein [Bacillus cereus]EOO67003.1 hypothetical protein IKE_02785 [Bacillus cereus VD196]OTZ36364.1 hypothetical protein BK761_05060 [Bacillus thuringiensis serovar darmstadiensis]MBM6767857.1 hypothetical protein [Bacillus cereus]HDR6247052.1 hypothetical protein [Bacillus cereus]HDR6293513.1 hypothetical protein [Bacillus cereus]